AAGTAARAARARRSRAVYPSPTRAVAGTMASRAASWPGHDTPAPSAPQNTPNEVSMTPTANFMVFSGTRDSGARTAIPTAATTDPEARRRPHRGGRARRGEAQVLLVGTEGDRDEDHFQAFQQHSLE